MNDNGMGGRRVGKKYFREDHNIEEETNWICLVTGENRIKEWEQLLNDYRKDKKFIKSQKRKWLPPKRKK